MSKTLTKEECLKLQKLGNHLDNIGMHKEADYVDWILRKNAFNVSDMFAGASPMDALQQTLVSMGISKLGLIDGGFANEFLANLIAGFDQNEVSSVIKGETDLCEILSSEVTNALQKTGLETAALNKVEEPLEAIIFTLLGAKPDGLFAQSLSSVIGPNMLKQMFTTYVTQNNIVSRYMANLICSTIKPAVYGFFGGGMGAIASDLSDTAAEGVGRLREGVGELFDSGREQVQGLVEEGEARAREEAVRNILPDFVPDTVRDWAGQFAAERGRMD